MKIVCDACSAKYSIADEKVRGKVFKIRCKKCSNIIMVRGNAGGDGAQEQFEPQKEARVYDYGADGMSGDEPVWHLVINQEQVGPMTDAEVRKRFARGEIDHETYTWREGFSDWSPLASVEAFADLANAQPGKGGDAAAGMFGGGHDEGETAQSQSADLFSAAVGDAGDDAGSDLFGSSPSAGASGGLFGGNGASAQARDIEMSSEAERKLRGERNENSVLFSLNNLAALASDSPKAAQSSGPAVSPGPSAGMASGEGSGLIDIRSMASVYLDDKKKPAGPSSGSDADLPVFGQSAFAAPSPLLLPTAMPAANNNKLMYILLAVIGGLVVAVGVVLFLVLKGGGQPEVASIQPTAPVTDDEVKPPPAQPGEEPGAKPDGDTPAAKPASEGADDTTAPATEKTDGESAAGNQGSEATAKPGAARPAVTTRKPSGDSKPSRPSSSSESKPAKEDSSDSGSSGGKCMDEVGCLLADKPPPCCSKYSGKKPSGGSSSSSSKPKADSNLPEELSRSDIQTGMGKVRGKVQSCGGKHPAKGQVAISIKVSPSGSVSSATVKSSPNAALGNCVASAVKSAKFVKTQKGASFTYPYSF